MNIDNETITNSEDWEKTAYRFVAFLDILGFKERVARTDPSEIYKSMKQLSDMSNVVKEARQTTLDKYIDCSIEIFNFSDSIVIFTEGDAESEFEYFMIVVSAIMHNALQHKIPLKGGIAHGLTTVDTVNQIYFGQPIIDAFQMEEDVNYLGVVAHYSINEYLRIHEEKTKIYHNLVETKAYLKSGLITHLNLDYLSPPKHSKISPDQMSKFIERARKLINDLFNQMSGSPRRYVDNTSEIFEKILEIRGLK